MRIEPLARLGLLLFCLQGFASTLLLAQAETSARHVVVVSIDGFAAYALKDPNIPLPNLRKLAREGVVADSMLPINPTVTWPNHTAIVTGVGPDRHSVLYNGWAVRGGEGQPVKLEARVPKEQLVASPTIYDAASKAGLTTAEVDWVAIEKAPTITWSVAEWAEPGGKVEREMVAAGYATESDFRDFTKLPITHRDEIWTRAGEFLIEKHKVNLLLLHLLTTDTIQHNYGARSLAAGTAFALADAKVGRLVEACRRAGTLPQTTFIVVSDHGFKTYQKVIRLNALFKQKGLESAAWAVPEGGTAMVYVTREAEKADTLQKIRAAVNGLEGVSEVILPSDYAKYGYPMPEANRRMADLVIAATSGYAFDGATSGDIIASIPAGQHSGSHGYLNTDPDMHAIFIAAGAGIKSGATLGQIRNVDVAPTIARLLGLKMESVSRRELSEILLPRNGQ